MDDADLKRLIEQATQDAQAMRATGIHWVAGTLDKCADMLTIFSAKGLTACDSGRLPKGEDSRSEAECEASQSGAEGNRPNTSGQPT